jgi:glycosyltransferase involved in cell wall biosynthesis
MPFRNEAASLADVLASLATQTINRSRLRFIGVDSASSDGSGEIVRRWLRETGIAGEVIRVERPGIPVALNAGNSRAAADEIIVRLDAHTLYEPRYLETLLDALAGLAP